MIQLVRSKVLVPRQRQSNGMRTIAYIMSISITSSAFTEEKEDKGKGKYKYDRSSAIYCP